MLSVVISNRRGASSAVYDFPYKLDRAQLLTLSERVSDVWSLNTTIPKLASLWARCVVDRPLTRKHLLLSVPCTTPRGDHFDPCAIVEEVTSGFKRHSVQCVVGGSLAVMIYSMPRVTKDVDFNIDIPSGDKAEALLRNICKENCWDLICILNGQPNRNSVPMLPWIRVGIAVINVKGVHVELFLNDWAPTNLVHAKAFEVCLPSGQEIRIAPPQCIAFFKTLVFRINSKRARKDSQDVIDLLLSCPDLDRVWVREMLVVCQGTTGLSVVQWDAWVVEADTMED